MEKSRELKKPVSYMMTDPIADMLSRIRNGVAAHKSEVLVPFSNLKLWVANILVQEGYLEKAERLSDRFGTLRLVLRYHGKRPAIQSLRRISKPGLRVYRNSSELPRVRSDIGIAIVSTPLGVMTNKEARRRKLGGEVMCEVY